MSLNNFKRNNPSLGIVLFFIPYLKSQAMNVNIDKKLAIRILIATFIFVFLISGSAGFFIGKYIYNKPQVIDNGSSNGEIIRTYELQIDSLKKDIDKINTVNLGHQKEIDELYKERSKIRETYIQRKDGVEVISLDSNVLLLKEFIHEEDNDAPDNISNSISSEPCTEGCSDK